MRVRERCVPEKFGVFVEHTGSLADLETAGFRTESVVPRNQERTDIATGEIRTIDLPRLTAVDHLIRVELGPTLQPELNYSVPEVGADSVHAAVPGAKCRGVIVGVIDSGIDWRHGIFCDAQGNSRALRIWDQMLSRQPGERGIHPASLEPA
jgi:hypothetical protein